MAKSKIHLDVVAIVPARGGSKRLPRKNILPLDGKPLIKWTLDAAQASDVIDMVVVTSDDDEVLALAGHSQVKLIKRPEHLSSDTATTADVIIHALDRLKEQGIEASRVMLLQPTSPLRRSKDIRSAIKKMDTTGANSIISVCEVDHSPLWCNTLDAEERMDDFIEKSTLNKRSQDLPVYYRLNGAIYLTFVSCFREKRSFFTNETKALIMDSNFSVDIDAEMDFSLAQVLINKYRSFFSG